MTPPEVTVGALAFVVPTQVPVLTEFRYVRVVRLDGPKVYVKTIDPSEGGGDEDVEDPLDAGVLRRRMVANNERVHWPGSFVGKPIAFIQPDGVDMDTWVYGVVTGYSIQGDDTRLHIQHASGACKVVLQEPANVIRVDWLNYVLQPGVSVNSAALNAVELLATMNDMSTLCAKVRGSLPTKVSNALSVPFIPEELVTMNKPDTLAVVMVPRQHVLECALNKKRKRGSSMFVAPSGTTTRRSAKRKAASKPTQDTRPRSRQKRVIDTPSDDSESEASVLLSSDEERADKLA
ncbi:hypothetical protein PR001_g16727, partial [Phytophthora rubi]